MFQKRDTIHYFPFYSVGKQFQHWKSTSELLYTFTADKSLSKLEIYDGLHLKGGPHAKAGWVNAFDLAKELGINSAEEMIERFIHLSHGDLLQFLASLEGAEEALLISFFPMRGKSLDWYYLYWINGRRYELNLRKPFHISANFAKLISHAIHSGGYRSNAKFGEYWVEDAEGNQILFTFDSEIKIV